MDSFRLDPQLEKDCLIMGGLGSSVLLLLNNEQVPWFILVPKVDAREIYELEEQVQLDLLSSINRLSKFIKDEFTADKLNVAAIGNIVSQLHIHVIGRNKTDYYWPGVVWGQGGATPYARTEVERIRRVLDLNLDNFVPSSAVPGQQPY